MDRKRTEVAGAELSGDEWSNCLAKMLTDGIAAAVSDDRHVGISVGCHLAISLPVGQNSRAQGSLLPPIDRDEAI